MIRPEYKPTNLGIPLDTGSAHPVHVHTSWPRAVLRRAMLLSSTLHGAEAAREVLRQRFIQHFAPKPIIDIFEGNAYKENDEPKQSQKQKRRKTAVVVHRFSPSVASSNHGRSWRADKRPSPQRSLERGFWTRASSIED